MVTLTPPLSSLRHAALVDSGVDANLKDLGLATSLKVPFQPLPSPVDARALDGCYFLR